MHSVQSQTLLAFIVLFLSVVLSNIISWMNDVVVRDIEPIQQQNNQKYNPQHKNNKYQCNEPHSCQGVLKLSNSNLSCFGDSSCVGIHNSHLRHIRCYGQFSCVFIQDTIIGNKLDCDGTLSCMNSSFIIHPGSHVIGEGSFSLTNSILYIKDNHRNTNDTNVKVKITLSGYYAGYNLTIYCNITNQDITIVCLENACVNTNIVTTNEPLAFEFVTWYEYIPFVFDKLLQNANEFEQIINHQKSNITIICYSLDDFYCAAEKDDKNLNPKEISNYNHSRNFNIHKIEKEYEYFHDLFINMIHTCDLSNDDYGHDQSIDHGISIYNRETDHDANVFYSQSNGALIKRIEYISREIDEPTVNYDQYDYVCARTYHTLFNKSVYLNTPTNNNNHNYIDLLPKTITNFNTVVCGAAYTCQSHFIDSNSVNFVSNQSMYCLGAGSCSGVVSITNSTIHNNNSNSLLQFQNIENIYCAGSESCMDIEILNPSNVYFLYNRFFTNFNHSYVTIHVYNDVYSYDNNNHIYNNNRTANIWFRSYRSGAYVKIICESNTVCNIYCDTLESCTKKLTALICKGTCNIYCYNFDNDYEYCTRVDNGSIGIQLNHIDGNLVFPKPAAEYLFEDTINITNLYDSYYKSLNQHNQILQWAELMAIIVCLVTIQWRIVKLHRYWDKRLHVSKIFASDVLFFVLIMCVREVQPIAPLKSIMCIAIAMELLHRIVAKVASNVIKSTSISTNTDEKKNMDELHINRGMKTSKMHQTICNSLIRQVCHNSNCSKRKYLILHKEKKTSVSIHRNKFYKCKGCLKVKYCSRKCQKYDWNINGHKYSCSPEF